ncbi:unnamed protein product [Penicillium salamii]|nr:unnamed protein product [Penicillium salamii]
MVAPFVCGTCFTRFSTNTHLRRHEESHLPIQRYGCYFCDQSYPRKDTTRRHAKACSKRYGRPLPPTEKKGTPRKSCDECARNKTSCDRKSPCGYCKNNALSCSYSRVLPRPQLTATATKEKPSAPSVDCPDMLLKARIPFLLRYYDAKNTVLDLIPALEAGRQNLSTQSGDAASVRLEPIEGYLDETHFDDSPLIWSSTTEPNNHGIIRGTNEPIHYHPHEILAKRVQELVEKLNHVTDSDASRGNLKNAMDQDFFSINNIRAFQHLYVQHFHRHCPIIHLPTFQAESAPLPLLLAIFLGGALNSFPRDTYSLAIDCLDIAEAYVFSLPVFKIEYKHAASSHLSEDSDALKGLIILLQLQIGRNNHDIRRRIRYQRFPRLVHAARSMSLFRVTQDCRVSASQPEIWDAQSESLRRTAAFILLLDSQFVFTLRSPPMITVPELTVNLPCDEFMFRYQNSSSVNTPCSASLVRIIDYLMDGAWDGPHNPIVNNIGIFGLFTVISGL